MQDNKGGKALSQMLQSQDNNNTFVEQVQDATWRSASTRNDLTTATSTGGDGEQHLDGDAADTLPAQLVTDHLGLPSKRAVSKRCPHEIHDYMFSSDVTNITYMLSDLKVMIMSMRTKTIDTIDTKIMMLH